MPDGQVKLGNFDFARVSGIGYTISKTNRPHPPLPSKFIAPEQQFDPRQAGPAADIYSPPAITGAIM
jgi:hypothetical protein